MIIMRVKKNNNHCFNSFDCDNNHDTNHYHNDFNSENTALIDIDRNNEQMKRHF